MGFFFRSSRAANSVVHGPISPNFELIQALMYIIVTCKYEMNPIKNVPRKRDGAVFPTVTLSFAMETSGRIWLNYLPQPKGGAYCFWCRWRRRRRLPPRCFVSARYLLNRWTDFDQTCTDTLLGGRNELIRFW